MRERRGVARFRRNGAAVAGAWAVAVVVACCLIGPLLLPFDPARPDFAAVSLGPSFASGHWFGTDDLGRDLLARTLAGGRLSLLIGMTAALVAFTIGTTWGSLAGFFGGAVDQLMMRVVDFLYGLPVLFFIILLTLVIGRGFAAIIGAIGALAWLNVAIVVRGQALALRDREFIEAARASGMKPLAIIRHHIVPNAIGPVISYASLLVPAAILAESFLSFLGLGIREPQASWGNLIAAGASTMDAEPWRLLLPGSVLAITLVSMNFIADGLRDAFDPRVG